MSANDSASVNCINVKKIIRGVESQLPGFVLIDNVQHESYDKIRLCRTMVTDHLLENYAEGCNSVLQQLDEYDVV